MKKSTTTKMSFIDEFNISKLTQKMQKQLRKSILENYLFMNKSFILRIQDYFSSMKIKEIIGDRQLQKFVIDLLKNLKTA